MRNYQSHKIVEAGRIVGFAIDALNDNVDVLVTNEGGSTESVPVATKIYARITDMAADGGFDIYDGYLVRYPADNYISWSPAAVFLAGYDLAK